MPIARGFSLLFFIALFTANSQIKKPSLSPRIKTEQHVGLAKVTLEYGQPNMQGRTIFGKLIPYGKLWRTGANSSTKISFDRDVTVAGNKLAKGDYSLYSIPNKEEWTIIFNTNTKHWGTAGYAESDDAIRFQVKSTLLKNARETFQIYFENFDANGGDMVIAWENTKIAFPVFVDSDALILAEIDEKITNAQGEIKAQTYFDAAQFYYFKKIDLNKAEEWFEKAIALRPKAFWYRYYRAELAYSQGKNAIAKEYAQRCLQDAQKSAQTSSDFGYIAKAELLLEKL